jgi:hypothetical protein
MKIPTTNHQPGRPCCLICASPHLRGGSFILAAGGQALDLCVTDAKHLRELSPIEREEALAELVTRVVPDWARIAA